MQQSADLHFFRPFRFVVLDVLTAPAVCKRTGRTSTVLCGAASALPAASPSSLLGQSSVHYIRSRNARNNSGEACRCGRERCCKIRDTRRFVAPGQRAGQPEFGWQYVARRQDEFYSGRRRPAAWQQARPRGSGSRIDRLSRDRRFNPETRRCRNGRASRASRALRVYRLRPTRRPIHLRRAGRNLGATPEMFGRSPVAGFTDRRISFARPWRNRKSPRHE